MPLSQSSLASNLKNLGLYNNIPEAAAAWADAYASYAANATSCAGGAPAGITAAKATLQASIVGAFGSSQDPSSMGAALGTAFAAFWMAPPMLFSGGVPGVVTVAPGAVALPSLLGAAFAANAAARSSKEEAMDRLAGVLHTFTTTVVVQHGVPPAVVCVGPIA